MRLLRANHFLPFKGRRLDVKRPVWVYRNLHGDSAHLYSLRQGGLVRGHTDRMMLTDCRFKVSEAGRKRVLATGRKNVHAYIVGTVRDSAMGTDAQTDRVFGVQVTYNPRRHVSFVSHPRGQVVELADAVLLHPTGVFATYTYP